MKKIALFVVLVIAAIIIITITRSTSSVTSDPMVIGGSTDEHGCLVGAGYSWDEAAGSCSRSWEREISIVASGAEYVINGMPNTSFVVTTDGTDYQLSAKICNQISGKLTYDNTTHTITGGPFMSTKMACVDQALSQLESSLPAALESGATITLTGNNAFTLTAGTTVFTFVPVQ